MVTVGGEAEWSAAAGNRGVRKIFLLRPIMAILLPRQLDDEELACPPPLQD